MFRSRQIYSRSMKKTTYMKVRAKQMIVLFVVFGSIRLACGGWNLEPYSAEDGFDVHDIVLPDFDSLGVDRHIDDRLNQSGFDIVYRFHCSKSYELYTVAIPSGILKDKNLSNKLAFVEKRMVKDGKLLVFKTDVNRVFVTEFMKTLSRLEIMDLPTKNSLEYFGGGCLGGDYFYAEEKYGERHRLVIRNTCESFPAMDAVDVLIPMLENILLKVVQTVDTPSNLEEILASIEAGADVNAADEYGVTALMWAAQDERVDIVKTIINAGADVNARNRVGKNALMYACYNPNPEVIKALLNANPDVDAKSKYGQTALMFAATSMDSEIATSLIEAGADVNARDNEGGTPLIWAVKGYANPDVISILLDAGADPKHMDDYGRRAIDYGDGKFGLKESDAYQKLKNATFAE